jgi:hypothetical protein
MLGIWAKFYIKSWNSARNMLGKLGLNILPYFFVSSQIQVEWMEFKREKQTTLTRLYLSFHFHLICSRFQASDHPGFPPNKHQGVLWKQVWEGQVTTSGGYHRPIKMGLDSYTFSPLHICHFQGLCYQGDGRFWSMNLGFWLDTCSILESAADATAHFPRTFWSCQGANHSVPSEEETFLTSSDCSHEHRFVHGTKTLKIAKQRLELDLKVTWDCKVVGAIITIWTHAGQHNIAV